MSQLRIYRGDTVTFKLTFKDNDGNAVDITGGTLYFTAKKTKTNTDANADIQASNSTFSDPTNGIGEVTLSKTDTDVTVDTYYYDFQFINSSGAISTVKAGDLIVAQDITLAES